MKEKTAAETNLELDSKFANKQPGGSRQNLSAEEVNMAIKQKFYDEDRQDHENVAPNYAAGQNTLVIDLNEMVED